MTISIINDELDQLITDAIKGDTEALDSLRFGEWFENLKNEIATRKAFRFGVDREEIRDAIFDTLSTNIRDINNPNNCPLAKCLCAWCARVATSFCLNKLRHLKVENKFAERLAARETISGIRRSTEGGAIPLRSRDAHSPDEILIEKEEAESRERIIADVCFEAKKHLDNASPTDTRIVILWGAGRMTLEQISEATRIPLSTVQRHLIAWQKPIIQEDLLQQTIIDNSKRQIKIVNLIRIAVSELYSGRTIFLRRRHKKSR